MCESLKPSDRFILQLLEHRGPLTRREIATETGYSLKTVERALPRLLDRGRIVKKPHPNDGRKRLYDSKPASSP